MTPYIRKTRRPRNKHPEADLQAKIARFLDEHLPPEIVWSASAPSIWLPPHVAKRFKELGVRRGWTDLNFALPNQGVRVVELKTDDAESSLKPEQKKLRDILEPLGHWARCRTIEQLVDALQGWGVRLNPSPIWRAEMMVEREE